MKADIAAKKEGMVTADSEVHTTTNWMPMMRAKAACEGTTTLF